MRRAWLRSTLFNLAFFSITAFLCFAYIPLLLLPRRWFVAAVKFWIQVITALEYGILGLSYEIRGREFLPQAGSYLIAAKHQSSYETFKLRLLFDDPAIVLKKELLRIPLWGAYLKKSDVIAIDRSTPEHALKSLEEGALRMKEQGRPIVIFPQGTRVLPEETSGHKPYKAGIARVQEATDLPIIPMALNSGLFWPRSGWLKSPGRVVFQFLEPIAPGQNRKEMMTKLEKSLEESSNALMNEARAEALDQTPGVKSWIGVALIIALLFGVYSVAWFETAKTIQKSYVKIVGDIVQPQNPHTPVVSGYPGPIKLDVAEELIQTDQGSLQIQALHAAGWPIPFLPVLIKTGPVTVNSFKWPAPLVIERTQAHIIFYNDILNILDSEIRLGEFLGGVTGTVDLKQEPVPKFDLTLSLENHQDLLMALAQSQIIEPRSALFMGAGFSALADEKGVVRVPLTQRDQTLYAGPLPVASLPVLPRQAPGNQPAPDL